MTFALTDLTVLIGLCLLVGAALHDVAVRTVPNWVSVALLPMGIVARLVSGDLLLGLTAALCVFAAAVALWLFGLMGGGDSKLLGAVALLVPPGRLPELLLATAICGGVLAIVYLVMSQLISRPAKGKRRTIVGRIVKAERWRLSRRGPLPYAVAIAGGGVLSLSPLLAVP
jgi:prepilin peptidase CpaA